VKQIYVLFEAHKLPHDDGVADDKKNNQRNEQRYQAQTDAKESIVLQKDKGIVQ
jgi:hypothetical protein